MSAQPPAERVVLVLNETLPLGQMANAAVVLGLTLGAKFPQLLGADMKDADGQTHTGTYPAGLPVLRAAGFRINQIRDQAESRGVVVCDFPTVGQTTTDYQQFTEQVAASPTADLASSGVILYGPKKAVNSLVGSLPLLR
jgi:hypothetical protein